MVPIPFWATTLMVRIETVYINIYMKVKNIQIFKNSNRYFAILIHHVYIYYVYTYMYTYIIHTLYYIIYIVLYIYQQGFPYWGIGDDPPTSQKFAHSRRTGNNFFPTKG